MVHSSLSSKYALNVHGAVLHEFSFGWFSWLINSVLFCQSIFGLTLANQGSPRITEVFPMSVMSNRSMRDLSPITIRWRAYLEMLPARLIVLSAFRAVIGRANGNSFSPCRVIMSLLIKTPSAPESTSASVSTVFPPQLSLIGMTNASVFGLDITTGEIRSLGGDSVDLFRLIKNPLLLAS